jgi:hypothetical protein
VELSEILGTILVAAFTGYVTFRIQERRIKQEMKSEFMAERAVYLLLSDDRWKKRSFVEIQKRLGDGFEEKELRKILLRAGAVRFEKKESKEELWGLLEKNKKDL